MDPNAKFLDMLSKMQQVGANNTDERKAQLLYEIAVDANVLRGWIEKGGFSPDVHFTYREV